MDIETIGELINMQDNRMTDQPMFIVQEKERIYGMSEGHVSDYEWYNHEMADIEHDEDEIKLLDTLDERGELPDRVEKAYYIDKWMFVTACFTEQGCKDYLRANGHNHGVTRIYGWHSHRNAEFQAVRNHLMSVTT